jgi:hypothetical protein
LRWVSPSVAQLGEDLAAAAFEHNPNSSEPKGTSAQLSESITA